MKQYLSKVLRKFERDERGSFSVFVTVMMSSILLAGGSAIDIIRHETVRSSIQYNLDRAVLAAASLRQTGDEAAAADIVRDYMSKVSTLAEFQADIDLEKTSVTLTGRTVSAYATAELNTFFLGLMGIDELDVYVTSTASEKIPNLEISMVLDVSGSMRGNKISALKTAANDFIDTVVLDPAQANGTVTTVSIVPYATNVSLPEEMFDLYTTEELHDNDHCIIFDNDEFASTALPLDVELKQLSSYAFNRYSSGSNFGDLNHVGDCLPDSDNAYGEILPFSTDPVALKAKINGLQADGYTATHIGTRWGAALLDRSAVSIANNLGSPLAADHPKTYSEPGVLKALIVMSDGNNTRHRQLKDPYRSGPSPIYQLTETDGNGNIVPDGANIRRPSYYVKRTDDSYRRIRQWGSPYNDFYFDYTSTVGSVTSTTISNLPSITDAATCAIVPQPANAICHRNLDWSEVWSETMTLNDYSAFTRADSLLSNVYTSDIYGDVVSATQADTNMRATCDAAKQNDNIIVYTIFFGDSNTSGGVSNAEQLLSDCASGPGQFYNVTGLDIQAAFASIAISVQKLKLTQ